MYPSPLTPKKKDSSMPSSIPPSFYRSLSAKSFNNDFGPLSYQTSSIPESIPRSNTEPLRTKAHKYPSHVIEFLEKELKSSKNKEYSEYLQKITSSIKNRFKKENPKKQNLSSKKIKILFKSVFKTKKKNKEADTQEKIPPNFLSTLIDSLKKNKLNTSHDILTNILKAYKNPLGFDLVLQICTNQFALENLALLVLGDLYKKIEGEETEEEVKIRHEKNLVEGKKTDISYEDIRRIKTLTSSVEEYLQTLKIEEDSIKEAVKVFNELKNLLTSHSEKNEKENISNVLDKLIITFFVEDKEENCHLAINWSAVTRKKVLNTYRIYKETPSKESHNNYIKRLFEGIGNTKKKEIAIDLGNKYPEFVLESITPDQLAKILAIPPENVHVQETTA